MEVTMRRTYPVKKMNMTTLMESNIQLGLNNEEALLTWATKRLANYEEAVTKIADVEKYYNESQQINHEVLIEDVKAVLARN